MSERRLMSVRSELVKETLVDTICERVDASMANGVPPAVAVALEAAPSSERAARAGYFARIIETELFEAARAPMPQLAEELAAGVEVARTLAAREPLDRPDPNDADAVSWRIPGPGGHVRHYVALRLVEDGRASLKSDFMYGFLVRCCEEVLQDS
jgi:hypothetical protein